VIYTALIKVYLVARPVLVGSLCRIENWCDVEEVEELLKEKQARHGPAALFGLLTGRSLATSSTCIKARKCTIKRWPCYTSKHYGNEDAVS
jgi:hypothetical protein